eukprot:1041477-Rhodomonas_salina.1
MRHVLKELGGVEIGTRVLVDGCGDGGVPQEDGAGEGDTEVAGAGVAGGREGGTEAAGAGAVSYTHLRAHETEADL